LGVRLLLALLQPVHGFLRAGAFPVRAAPPSFWVWPAPICSLSSTAARLQITTGGGHSPN